MIARSSLVRAATGLVGVRDDDLRGLGGGDVGVERADERDREPGAEKLGHDVGRDGAGAMPAKVSESIRPTLIAGLAKLVELVKR